MSKQKFDERARRINAGRLMFKPGVEHVFTPDMYKIEYGSEDEETEPVYEELPTFKIIPLSKAEKDTVLDIGSKKQSDSAHVYKIIAVSLKGWSYFYYGQTDEEVPYETNSQNQIKEELFDSLPEQLKLSLYSEIIAISGLTILDVKDLRS